MPNIGPVEIIIVVVILLLVFGTKRLPEAGKNLGKGMREFKDSVTGKDSDDEKQLSATPPPTPAAAPAPPPQAEQAPEPETARSGERSA
ncbi:MAG TPA: twin-arginine translocase TatA/TatE family subunit [Thermoleophilaceae bacterium]|jgi:sec-independent protein translocase protein TatA